MREPTPGLISEPANPDSKIGSKMTEKDNVNPSSIFGLQDAVRKNLQRKKSADLAKGRNRSAYGSANVKGERPFNSTSRMGYIPMKNSHNNLFIRQSVVSHALRKGDFSGQEKFAMSLEEMRNARMNRNLHGEKTAKNSKAG